MYPQKIEIIINNQNFYEWANFICPPKNCFGIENPSIIFFQD
jgi:hypothetical protein